MKTINGWTKAKMIEHIKANFKGKSVSQISNSFGTSEICAYRGEQGKKCAVGMFIPDNNYSIRMEKSDKNSAEFVIKNYNLDKDMPLEIRGMEILQNMHDRSSEQYVLNNLIEWIEETVEDSEVTV